MTQLETAGCALLTFYTHLRSKKVPTMVFALLVHLLSMPLGKIWTNHNMIRGTLLSLCAKALNCKSCHMSLNQNFIVGSLWRSFHINKDHGETTLLEPIDYIHVTKAYCKICETQKAFFRGGSANIPLIQRSSLQSVMKSPHFMWHLLIKRRICSVVKVDKLSRYSPLIPFCLKVSL